jgi:hypothetical protein
LTDLIGLSRREHKCSRLPSSEDCKLEIKVYANIKLQGATLRIEDSIKLHEGSYDPKPTKATREALTLQDLNCELKTF